MYSQGHTSGPPRVSFNRSDPFSWRGRDERESELHKIGRATDREALNDYASGLESQSLKLNNEELEKARSSFYAKEEAANYKEVADYNLNLEFQYWLQGVSTYNQDKGYEMDTEILDIDGMDDDGKATPNWYAGKKTLKKHTQWGKEDLTHLPGVRNYLQSKQVTDLDDDLEIAKLHYFGPQDLTEAWKYFTRIVKERRPNYDGTVTTPWEEDGTQPGGAQPPMDKGGAQPPMDKSGRQPPKGRKPKKQYHEMNLTPQQHQTRTKSTTARLVAEKDAYEQEAMAAAYAKSELMENVEKVLTPAQKNKQVMEELDEIIRSSPLKTLNPTPY